MFAYNVCMGNYKNRTKQTPSERLEEKLDPDNRAHELRRMGQLIKTLRGCCRGKDSLVDALHHGRQEKSFTERRLEYLESKPRSRKPL